MKKCPGQRIEVFTDVGRHAATIHLISRQGRALADNSQLNGEVNQSQSPCQWSSNTYRVCRLLNRFTLVTLRLDCGGCEIRHRIGSRFHHHASINDAQILIFKSNIKIFGQLAVFFQWQAEQRQVKLKAHTFADQHLWLRFVPLIPLNCSKCFGRQQSFIKLFPFFQVFVRFSLEPNPFTAPPIISQGFIW